MKSFNASIACVLFNDIVRTVCPNVSVQLTFQYFLEEESVCIITVITYNRVNLDVLWLRVCPKYVDAYNR